MARLRNLHPRFNPGGASNLRSRSMRRVPTVALAKVGCFCLPALIPLDSASESPDLDRSFGGIGTGLLRS